MTTAKARTKKKKNYKDCGIVWVVAFDTADNDPSAGKALKFTLKRLNDGRTDILRIPAEVGVWLEDILALAHKQVGPVNKVTVVPTEEVMRLFTNLK